jgi:disulfide bond formation protein DsbB
MSAQSARSLLPSGAQSRQRSLSRDVGDLNINIKKKYGAGAYFLGFIILAVIVWLILYLWKPSWVQQKDAMGNATGNINTSAIIIWSIVIAAIITAIVWLIMSI